jgi:O-antigen ligase
MLLNQFIEQLARFGLIGFIPFILMNVAVVKQLVDAAKVSFCESDKWLVWCLAAGLCGLGAAMMSVSLFGEPTNVYYLMMGFAGVMPKLVSRPEGTSYSLYALQTSRGQW